MRAIVDGTLLPGSLWSSNCAVFLPIQRKDKKSRSSALCDLLQVLVMDAGQMVEFDHPHILLNRPGGVLRGMVDQTGRAMADTLARIALQVRIQLIFLY